MRVLMRYRVELSRAIDEVRDLPHGRPEHVTELRAWVDQRARPLHRARLALREQLEPHFRRSEA